MTRNRWAHHENNRGSNSWVQGRGGWSKSSGEPERSLTGRVVSSQEFLNLNWIRGTGTHGTYGEKTHCFSATNLKLCNWTHTGHKNLREQKLSCTTRDRVVWTGERKRGNEKQYRITEYSTELWSTVQNYVQNNGVQNNGVQNNGVQYRITEYSTE